MSPLRTLARTVLPRAVRNWLRSPSATLRWLRDGVRHAAGADIVAEVRPGWRIRCHPAAWRLAYRFHVEDVEQRAELDAFLASCRPGMVLVDVGAHYGLFSLAAVHCGGPGASAIAVEPSAPAIRMLRDVAEANGLGDRITTVLAAGTDHDGPVELVSVGVQAGDYLVSPGADHGPAERTVVPGVTLDGLCRNLDRSPTHLKIDVEGAEEAVLLGGSRTLALARPLVFLELHVALIRQRGGDPARPVRVLESHGYQVALVGGTPLTSGSLPSGPVLRLVGRVGDGFGLHEP